MASYSKQTDRYGHSLLPERFHGNLLQPMILELEGAEGLLVTCSTVFSLN